MPALLEPDAVEPEALTRPTADSWPAGEPHNRYKPRDASRIFSVTGICFALIVVGVIWRAWQLDQVPNVNGDEAWYGVQSQRFLDEYLYGKTLLDADRVSFRTPTGNIWNPFLMIPRVVLDALFEPSVFSLRLPALISGVLSLLVNWWLCRRAFGRTTAWLTTALLSVLPITVIYSRLGWDACQSILFCLPLLYLPLIAELQGMSGSRTAIYFVLALAAALFVHPTNIFLVPLCAVLLWSRISAVSKLEFSLRTRVMLAVAAVSMAIVLGISRGAWTGIEFENVISALAQWAGDVVGLFNGATVYGSISLPTDELPAAQRWLLLLSLPTLALLIWTRVTCKTSRFSQQNLTSSQRYAAVFDGTCLALLCFLGVAGPGAIQPGYERYGLWIVAPGVVLIVLSYSTVAVRSRGFLAAILILAGVQIVLLLAGYWNYYQQRFDVLAAEQRLAHWTYRSDNFANWAELKAEFELSLETPDNTTRKLILVLKNDPQRWWFEWKWRYLSYDSGYEWQLISSLPEAETLKTTGTQRWILQSPPESQKENLAIRYLAH